jgi:hypothetical protein
MRAALVLGLLLLSLSSCKRAEERTSGSKWTPATTPPAAVEVTSVAERTVALGEKMAKLLTENGHDCDRAADALESFLTSNESMLKQLKDDAAHVGEVSKREMQERYGDRLAKVEHALDPILERCQENERFTSAMAAVPQ